MWSWNINGWGNAELDVLQFLKDHGPTTILVLIDTRLPDLVRVHRMLPEWRMLHLNRPHHVHRRKKRIHGGILVLWHPHYNRVCRESAFPKGALSFVYQDVAQRFRPVPVVALYSPPVGSTLNTGGKHWSDDILSFAGAESHRLRCLYGFAHVMGDFNWRLGSKFNRESDDVVKHSSNARTGRAVAWHHENDLRPLYGRPGQHREECTSRVQQFVAAPDGVSCPTQVPAGWELRALAPPAWDEYSTSGGVHRPIGVTTTPPLLQSPARPVVPPPDTAAASKAQYYPAVYGSSVYHTMAPAVAQCITSVAQQLNQGTLTPATAMTSLAQGLVDVQSQHFSQRRPWSVQRKARSRHDLRHRNPTTSFRRTGNGVSLPKDVKDVLKQKRVDLARSLALRKRARELRRLGYKSEADDFDKRAKAAKQSASHLHRTAKRHMQSNTREYYKREGNRLAKMLRNNPHKFFRVMKKVVPETHELHDESSGPSLQKATEFREFFAKLFQRLRDEPDGHLLDRFVAGIPLTDAEATRAVLMAQISWQEVYAVLYPAHKKATRPPCQPDCKLCPLYSQHVHAAHNKPGNTSITEPEHRPRLWTSKSAGPDGVFAETLRWSSPKEVQDRFEYRMSICESFASIFNRFITDGAVPDCPQFAEAVMSVLYKGVGSRDDASNHRGICVPNVLAKLFGLVLGTRLSHWAVTSGVISPAQVGFVVLHGCEYHIMTLLEALRHRVRRDCDTVLVFLDFKKAYDNVSQSLAWTLMQKMGVPSEFTGLLKSWADQSRITLRMGGAAPESFRQEKGVPQGGVLSPIIFNLVIEVLLRYVNAHAAELGVTMSAEIAESAARAQVGAEVAVAPPPLQLLALAYADDVVLICPNKAAAQRALDLVQDWSEHFGFTIGVGAGKTEAMFISAATVKAACAKDENGMLDPRYRDDAEPVDAHPDANANADPDDDHDTVLDLDDADDDCNSDADEHEDAAAPAAAGLRKGQEWDGTRKRGKHTITPLKFRSRPLPPVPESDPLLIHHINGASDEVVPWTNRYKYLGFMLRSDLMDDDAYERVERKTRIAAERLFPLHRLIRSFPLGHKIQLLQTIVLAVTANITPLLTSMRSATELKLTRLDNMRKRVAKEVVRLHHTSRREYVTAEAGLGDVLGDVTMHRVRLLESLLRHPLRDSTLPLDRQPIACRMLDIMLVESQHIKINGPRRVDLLLCPWPLITARIIKDHVDTYQAQGWQQPNHRWEIAPYASAVARIGERERWLHNFCKKDCDETVDSFAVRPPSNSTRQVAALHFPTRLSSVDAGRHPKLTPLSVRGPHGMGSVVSLCRIASTDTFMISKARQGNAAMHIYPFATLARSGPKEPGKKRKASGASKATAFEGKTCHLCSDGDDGPGYDLWHVLFECPRTAHHSSMVEVRKECQRLTVDLSHRICSAATANSASMSSTEHAGVDHRAIYSAAHSVQQLAPNYDWDCLPGKWLMYCMLLALPFSEKVVVPPQGSQSPALSAAESSLPLAMGKLFDATVLSSDALRPLADEWCRRVVCSLRAAGSVVTPLRAAAEERREHAKAARRAAATTGDGASGRRRKPDTAATQDAARTAHAVPQDTGRGRPRAAHAAPKAAGRRRTVSKP